MTETLPSGTKLSFAKRRFTDADVAKLPFREDSSYHYDEVDFSGNDLSLEGLRAILDICARCKQLRVLKLFRNRFGDDGAKALASFLRKNTSIEELHLSHNNFSGEGVRAIVEAADQGRPRDINPLWLRLEQNQVPDHESVMKSLESRYQVCARRDGGRCSVKQCKYGMKVHLPYFNIQRTSDGTPAGNDVRHEDQYEKGRGRKRPRVDDDWEQPTQSYYEQGSRWDGYDGKGKEKGSKGKGKGKWNNGKTAWKEETFAALGDTPQTNADKDRFVDPVEIIEDHAGGLRGWSSSSESEDEEGGSSKKSKRSKKSKPPAAAPAADGAAAQQAGSAEDSSGVAEKKDRPVVLVRRQEVDGASAGGLRSRDEVEGQEQDDKEEEEEQPQMRVRKGGLFGNALKVISDQPQGAKCETPNPTPVKSELVSGSSPKVKVRRINVAAATLGSMGVLRAKNATKGRVILTQAPPRMAGLVVKAELSNDAGSDQEREIDDAHAEAHGRGERRREEPQRDGEPSRREELAYGAKERSRGRRAASHPVQREHHNHQRGDLSRGARGDARGDARRAPDPRARDRDRDRHGGRAVRGRDDRSRSRGGARHPEQRRGDHREQQQHDRSGRDNRERDRAHRDRESHRQESHRRVPERARDADARDRRRQRDDEAPAVASSGKDRDRKAVLCPKGHSLRGEDAPYSGSCDGCGTGFAVHSAVRRCADCNYDLCVGCAKGPTSAPAESAPPRRRSDADREHTVSDGRRFDELVSEKRKIREAQKAARATAAAAALREASPLRKAASASPIRGPSSEERHNKALATRPKARARPATAAQQREEKRREPREREAPAAPTSGAPRVATSKPRREQPVKGAETAKAPSAPQQKALPASTAAPAKKAAAQPAAQAEEESEYSYTDEDGEEVGQEDGQEDSSYSYTDEEEEEEALTMDKVHA